VVMDEPTSSLSAREGKTLDEVMTRLRERGVSIVYISHFLDEVKRVADRYTVLRDGKTVATGDGRTTSTTTMVTQMVGRDLGDAYPRVAHEPGQVALSLDGLSGARAPKNVTLELRRGEVFGIAGLVGAGRTELLRALYGLDPVRAGRVRVGGALDLGRPVRARIAQGFGMLSEDRRGEGLALGMSIEDNATLCRLEPFARGGILNLRKRREAVRDAMTRLSIRARGPEQIVGELSGGNQQKVAFARLLQQDAEVLLLDEPTRGVDVGSKAEIYRRIGELAASGKAILLVSSYMPELLGVCDRIAVMFRGTLGRARATSEWSEVALLAEATQGAAA
jgi:ribose transport system ATP-binding protein